MVHNRVIVVLLLACEFSYISIATSYKYMLTYRKTCIPAFLILWYVISLFIFSLCLTFIFQVMNLIGDVKGKVAVMVDDMIDTAG